MVKNPKFTIHAVQNGIFWCSRRFKLCNWKKKIKERRFLVEVDEKRLRCLVTTSECFNVHISLLSIGKYFIIRPIPHSSTIYPAWSGTRNMLLHKTVQRHAFGLTEGNRELPTNVSSPNLALGIFCKYLPVYIFNIYLRYKKGYRHYLQTRSVAFSS